MQKENVYSNNIKGNAIKFAKGFSKDSVIQKNELIANGGDRLPRYVTEMTDEIIRREAAARANFTSVDYLIWERSNFH